MARLASYVASPDLTTALPARASVEGFAVRLKAEDTLGVNLAVGFRFPDIGEAYGLMLRRDVVQIAERAPEKVDLTLTLDKTVLDRVRPGQLAMRDAVISGSVRVSDGSFLHVARFFGYFELPFSTPIQLVVR